MVEATQNSQVQSQPPPSAADEALKRNTDCVYFLASPLTCKKGSECDYRHSEYARLNPRDCFYWLNGNCLNPKCGFRHPPLDALLGTQSAASGSSVPPPQPAVAPITHAAYNSGKQGVACIFFQKGQCIKGDKCSFSHGPNHKSSQPKPAPANESMSLKKPFVGLQKCTTTEERRAPPKPVEAKLAPRIETAPSRNVVKPLPAEIPRYRPPGVSSTGNGNSVTRSNRSHQNDVSDVRGLQNAYDGDELLRESSPGFDVLVDDDLRDSDYYQGEDQFGRRSGADVDEYNNVDHAANYNSVGDADRGNFRGYDQIEGQYHRGSSDRVERRGYDRPDRAQESDLRYRLSKHKSSNGLRSVVSRDNRSEERVPYRRDETSHASRLHGRVKLPERETRSRYSPGRPPITSSGRLHGRISGRVEEENNYNNDGRNFRPPRIAMRTDERNSDFAAPKSLAELKAKNNNDSALGKRKSLDEVEFRFDGPKPLSEILKRKRGEPNEEKNNKSEDLQTCEEGEYETEQVIEEHEVEGDQQIEGEYEYEQGDEGEYYEEEEGTYEEGAYEEEEYVEEEEEEGGEDISKKIDVMLS